MHDRTPKQDDDQIGYLVAGGVCILLGAAGIMTMLFMVVGIMIRAFKWMINL